MKASGSDFEAAERYFDKMRPHRVDWEPFLAAGVLLLVDASIAYLPGRDVGLLTRLGLVISDVSPEGTHLVNPLKRNNMR
jgi:hypothetical protein